MSAPAGRDAAEAVAAGAATREGSAAALPTFAVEPVAGGTAADGAYALFELRAAAGAALAPHRCALHDATLTVLGGEVEVVLADERRLLGPGSQLRLQRGRPRRCTVVADARVLCLSVPAGLERLAAALGDPPLDRDDLAALLADHGVALLPAGWGETVG